jgi:hypothetical protein
VCENGYADNRCGHGGVLCENCTNTNGTCQSGTCAGGNPANCPANYPGCSPNETNPQPIQALNACSPVTLKEGSVACTGDPTPAACSVWFQNLQTTSPDCYKCMLPFTGPKAVGTCLAPYLDVSCNHDLACSLDCYTVACSQCSAADQSLCQQNVWNPGSTCSGYTQGLYCMQAAAQGPGAFCVPTGDYGMWVYSVGNHYCGTGNP